MKGESVCVYYHHDSSFSYNSFLITIIKKKQRERETHTHTHKHNDMR
jgi:hypothetical protein